MRSPLAENIFRQQISEAGLADKYSVDSAGTAAYHIGDAPDARMREVAAQHGLIYSGRGRQFSQEDYEKFDLIIPMDMSNYSNLSGLSSDPGHLEKLRLMRDFDIDESDDRDIPDPYYGGMDGFEQVYQMIDRSTREMIRQLESGELII